MNILDLNALLALCAELEKKNKLLMRISASYTKAIALMEEQSYDLATEELDFQNAVFAELSDLGKNSAAIPCEYEDIRDKALAYLPHSNKSPQHSAALKKAAEEIELYTRLVKNCKTLNEKLTFLVTEKKSESERHIEASKNRRKINAGYNAQYSPKKGSIIDVSTK